MKNLLRLTLIILVPVLGSIHSFHAQHEYSLDLNGPDKKIYDDHLNLGGINDEGRSFEVNNFYLSENGQPIIPITGEFHFSRYPEAFWDDAIKKMKAGGINMVATYIFWNMHEEIEGQFVWEGNRNLRKFVKLCAENELPVIIRIGPFGHGEIRNGALPDWLLARPLVIRSNDPNYLSYVERLYAQIGQQLQGLFFKDGGPIIATQIENEYQASAAPWGLTYPGQPLDYTSSQRDKKFTQEGVGISLEENPYAKLGNEHMSILKSLAGKAGIETPLYTATGWGNAAIVPGETLPVTAAYAYPTWTRKKDISPFYLYKDIHSDPDYSPVRYNPEDYPAFAAELGGGIMSTYTRRPTVPPNSMDALINRCLGSGANGIGYYMYHGGSTPMGDISYFNDEAYGYPKISYDFQAPIGEFGQLRPSYNRLRLLHEFINKFGDVLAPMQTVLPENSSKIKPQDIQDVRYAARHKGGSGFLFLNNFQDDTLMVDKKNISIELTYESETTKVPEMGGFDLAAEENAIFPFNFKLNEHHLNYATAQLLTKFEQKEIAYYVFFSPEGVLPEFSIKRSEKTTLKVGKTLTMEKNDDRWLIKGGSDVISEFEITKGSRKTKLLVVPKSLALQFWLTDIDDEQHLLFSNATVLKDGNELKVLSQGTPEFGISIYPKTETKPKLSMGNISINKKSIFLSSYKVKLPIVKLDYNSKMMQGNRLIVSFPGGLPDTLENVFLNIDYKADTVMGFYDGKLVMDEFYKGMPWEIGLREMIEIKGAEQMNFYFRPIFENASYLVDFEVKLDFSNSKSILEVNNVKFVPEYKTQLSFE